MFHYGEAIAQHSSPRKKVKFQLLTLLLKLSSWNEILIVNPLVYESIKKFSLWRLKSVGIIPDPVVRNDRIDRVNAKQALGIPGNVVCIGHVGMLDERKAVPELLATFVRGQLFDKCCLVLMGRMSNVYTKLLDQKYKEYVSRGHIVVINRFLSNEEIHRGYTAVDVHLLIQYKRPNLSSNLLKAVAYGKPVVVDDYGYTGMMVHRFNLGAGCNVDSLESIIAATRTAMSYVDNYEQNPNLAKLVAFHDLNNFVNTVVKSIAFNHPLKNRISVRTWEWVCENLCAR